MNLSITVQFLGIDKNDVAIPIKQFEIENGKFILQGATKETLKKMPPFKYASKVEILAKKLQFGC